VTLPKYFSHPSFSYSTFAQASLKETSNHGSGGAAYCIGTYLTAYIHSNNSNNVLLLLLGLCSLWLIKGGQKGPEEKDPLFWLPFITSHKLLQRPASYIKLIGRHGYFLCLL
jgi:hypothetical protein